MRIALLARDCLLLLCCVSATLVYGQDRQAKMSLAGGKFELTAPASWVRKQPKSSIIEYEFAIPHAADDTSDGRLTVMPAGGSVDANIDRWYSQFAQPDGTATRDRAKVKKISAAGEDVHMVDISGTFKDQRGPAAPAVEQPKYRMLAAIITTKSEGNYLIKFYGPERTVAQNEPAFRKMIEGLERK
ncbi:MAG TPA: hypothetical protein VHV08_05005 [Pirellulales bacterium]|nr:hypothetical protein [Pirellulales bacterium]